ncbi:MAG: DNA sulfur modification protein DndB, partial [Eubacteriaceae bacterium]
GENMDFLYKFPALRGLQANHDYYIAMVPLKMLIQLFPLDEEYASPEHRAQRKINEARIPVITKYILDNRDSYVFSALAASIDGNFRYVSIVDNENIGVLEVTKDTKFLINDGQHRKTAIIEALDRDASLGDEMISIVFFADKGLEHSQQIFTDLNKNAVKTSNSMAELYDSRDPMAVITRDVIKKIEFFNKYTDKEKDILGKYSYNLFTLHTFYSTNKIIIGNNVGKNAESFLTVFWSLVAEHMVQWNELARKDITKKDLREKYIATKGIVIQALGRIGAYLYQHQEIDMQNTLKKIESINWRRDAHRWYMRAINQNGRIITNKRAAILIGNVIKNELDLPLTNDEAFAEEQLQKTIV